MTDYILAVADPAKWHSQNIERNRSHYSFLLASCGGNGVAAVADRIGSGVHFNALVPWRDQRIKYGVVGLQTLLRDLWTWDALYISGRLHKPVKTLVDQRGIAGINRVNLQSALAASLLLLPSEFEEAQLHETICGLSYFGDIRMAFAEDPEKVRKIARGCRSELRQLYRAPLVQFEGVDLLQGPSQGAAASSPVWSQDTGSRSLEQLILALPSAVVYKMAQRSGLRWSATPERPEGSFPDIALRLSQWNRKGVKELLQRSLSGIVRRSSFRQAVAGFFAAQGMNALRYVGRKMGRAWMS